MGSHMTIPSKSNYHVRLNVNMNIADSIPLYFNFRKGHVVSVPPHAMRTYIVSLDIVINMFYSTWLVFTDDRTFGDRTADYKKKIKAREEKTSEIHG